MLFIINKKDISFGHNQNRNLHTTLPSAPIPRFNTSIHSSCYLNSSCSGFCPSLLSSSPARGRRSRRWSRPTSSYAAAWRPRLVTTSCPGSASTTSSASSRRSASTAPRTRASPPCVQETKSQSQTLNSY